MSSEYKGTPRILARPGHRFGSLGSSTLGSTTVPTAAPGQRRGAYPGSPAGRLRSRRMDRRDPEHAIYDAGRRPVSENAHGATRELRGGGPFMGASDIARASRSR